MEFGSSPERKFCVPVSVRSNHVAKVIVPSAFPHDICVKYSHEKLCTLPVFTVLKLFWMEYVPESALPMEVLIVCRISLPAHEL